MDYVYFFVLIVILFLVVLFSLKLLKESNHVYSSRGFNLREFPYLMYLFINANTGAIIRLSNNKEIKRIIVTKKQDDNTWWLELKMPDSYLPIVQELTPAYDIKIINGQNTEFNSEPFFVKVTGDYKDISAFFIQVYYSRFRYELEEEITVQFVNVSVEQSILEDIQNQYQVESKENY
jgi:hypothetical protein